MPKSNYDTDFYAWTNEQAALLRAGRFSAADVETIAEEIASLGRTEKRELVSRLTVVLKHLLKWEFQPQARCSSLRTSIRVQRNLVLDHLQDNPSLKPQIPDAMAKANRNAVLEATEETGLSEAVFPTPCLWSFEQAIDDGFWPD